MCKNVPKDSFVPIAENGGGDSNGDATEETIKSYSKAGFYVYFFTLDFDLKKKTWPMATLLSAGELQLSLFSQMLPLGIPRLQGWIVCKIPRCWRATEEVEVKENPREEELLKRNSVLRRTVAAGRELQSRDVSEKKRIFRPQESFPTDNPKMVQPVGAGSV